MESSSPYDNDNCKLCYSLQCFAQNPLFLVESVSETDRGGREPMEKCLLKNGRLNGTFMLELVPNLGSLLPFFGCLCWHSLTTLTHSCRWRRRRGEEEAQEEHTRQWSCLKN